MSYMVGFFIDSRLSFILTDTFLNDEQGIRNAS